MNEFNQSLVTLKVKLCPIMTRSPESIERLARQVPPEQVHGVANTLRDFNRIEVTDKVTGETREKIRRGQREWLQSTQCALPVDSWKPDGEGLYSVRDLPGVSLKYSGRGEALEDAVAEEPQFLAREGLCRALFLALDPEAASRYESLASWGPLEMPDPEEHPHLVDVRVADSIYFVQEGFYTAFARHEQKERALRNLPENQPTPAKRIRKIATKAKDEVLSWLMRLSIGGPQHENNLVVATLCNIAANRALSESAMFGVLAEKACETNARLLVALNQCDVRTVPEVKDEPAVRELMLSWFGPDGKLSGESYFATPLEGKDLDEAMLQAVAVQQHYIKTRGRIGGAQSMRQYEGPRNLVLFALALAGCFYGHAEVKKEFFGEHAIMAFRARILRDKQPLGVHAMELFKSQFGHLAFSNIGWDLSPTLLPDYTRALAYKRARMQELIFQVFKGWPTGQLMALHKELMRELRFLKTASFLMGPRVVLEM